MLTRGRPDVRYTISKKSGSAVSARYLAQDTRFRATPYQRLRNSQVTPDCRSFPGARSDLLLQSGHPICEGDHCFRKRREFIVWLYFGRKFAEIWKGKRFQSRSFADCRRGLDSLEYFIRLLFFTATSNSKNQD